MQSALPTGWTVVSAQGQHSEARAAVQVEYDAGDALVQREGQKFNELCVFGAADPDYKLQVHAQTPCLAFRPSNNKHILHVMMIQ